MQVGARPGPRLVADEEEKFSPMDRRVEGGSGARRWLLLGCGAAVLLVVAVLLYVRFALTRSVTVREASVVVAPVRMEVFTEYVPATAVVAPRTTAYLDAVEGGQVAEVYVEEGAFVKRGQVLLKLKNTNLQLEMLGRQAQLMEQLDRLNQTILSFEQARVTHEKELIESSAQIDQLAQRQQRREALRATGMVSKEELDELGIDLTRARKLQAAAMEARDMDGKFRNEQVTQLRSAIKTTRENLDVASETMQSLLVKAPITGQLTALSADLGAAKTPGQRIGQIDDSTAYKVEAGIDEFYLGRVKTGQLATAESNGKTWKLEVAKVYTQVTDRQFKVDLYFREAAAPEGLRRGQTMQIRLEVGAPSRGLVTANGPFFEETGGNWVFVLPPTGTVAQRRAVRFGRRNPEQIEVLSGLTAGERILSSGYEQLRKFDRIEIKPEAN
ncbi:MAG TPA: HlyD family efflux transporter periplasmic adaptor subunit [Steroidobacteraceae bacterium]|jgi:HlyD family secretion protein